MKNYVVARTFLGWSDAEFWESSPRKLFAFLYAASDMMLQTSKDSVNKTALVGKYAINALSQMASYIR